MVELIVLYKTPNDPEHFEKYYREVHGPMTTKLAGVKSYSYGPVRAVDGGASESSGTGPAHSTALRLPSMPLPRRKARRALPTCRTTTTMFRSSCSLKSRRYVFDERAARS